MARRKASLLKDRAMRLAAQLKILREVGPKIVHRNKDSEAIFDRSLLYIEIRLEEVNELLGIEEADKGRAKGKVIGKYLAGTGEVIPEEPNKGSEELQGTGTLFKLDGEDKNDDPSLKDGYVPESNQDARGVDDPDAIKDKVIEKSKALQDWKDSEAED